MKKEPSFDEIREEIKKEKAQSKIKKKTIFDDFCNCHIDSYSFFVKR